MLVTTTNWNHRYYAVNSFREQIKQEMHLNHMSVIPNESDTDTGYKLFLY
jgi:hypothetical protein